MMRVLRTCFLIWCLAVLLEDGTAFVPSARKTVTTAHRTLVRTHVATATARPIPTTTTTTTLPDMTLLKPAQELNPSIRLEKMTAILLEEDAHPLGTLSRDVLDKTVPVMNAWAKSSTIAGARTAERVLDRLKREEEHNPRAVVTHQHYAVAMDAWVRSGHAEATRHAERLLDELSTRDNDSAEQPNRVVWNTLLKAYAQQGNVAEATRVLERMQECHVQPELQDYSTLLSAHAKAGDARQAEALLHRMVQTGPAPDVVSYNCVLDAWAKSGEAGAGERARAILDTLLKEDIDIQPNEFSFSSVATALIQNGADNVVEQVESLMQLAHANNIPMDNYLNNAVLEACCVHGSAQEAQRQLEQMERDGVTNTVSYNFVVQALKNSGKHNAPQKAEAILRHAKGLEMEDVYTYTSVMDCYAKSKQKGAAERAEQLFQEMIESSKNGRFDVKPNTVTVNCLLDALAKSGEKGAADRAEALLSRIEIGDGYEAENVHLDTISYTTVIDAHSNSGEKSAALKAQEILQRMQDAYRNGNRDAKPNVRTYNRVMNALVQSGKQEYAARAESILSDMEETYRNGDIDIVPNVVTYSIVMNGWSKSGAPNAAEKTAEIFNRMCEAYKSGNELAKPNLVSFVTLIHSIVNNGKAGAVQQAEDILFEMYAQYKAGNADVKPNSRLISSVIEAWRKSGVGNAGEKGEALLNWMIDTYKSEKDDDFQPSAFTFSAAINAWARSRHLGKAIRAKAILERFVDMHEQGLVPEPSVFAYGAVLNACACTAGDPTEKADAIQVATSTFEELCSNEYAEPNHVAYGAYLTACRNLMPDTDARAASMAAIFKKCCQAGQVNDIVLRIMLRALSAEQLDELGLRGDVNVSDLPKEWTANVGDRRKATATSR